MSVGFLCQRFPSLQFNFQHASCSLQPAKNTCLNTSTTQIFSPWSLLIYSSIVFRASVSFSLVCLLYSQPIPWDVLKSWVMPLNIPFHFTQRNSTILRDKTCRSKIWTVQRNYDPCQSSFIIAFVQISHKVCHSIALWRNNIILIKHISLPGYVCTLYTESIALTLR